MSLTVADIERWDPEALRQVAADAQARGQALASAAEGLAGLPGFGSWEGRAATASREAFEALRRELEGSRRDAEAVAQAARRATDAVEAITSDLRRLKVDVALYGCEVDAAANRVVPAFGAGAGVPVRRSSMPALQARLDSLVEQADSVDAELAAGLLSDGSAVPAVPSALPTLPAALPEDPRAFHDLWQRLSTAERDLLYQRDPGIGNHPGMPAGSPFAPGKDHYNRRHLAEELQRATATGSPDLADLQALDRALAAHPGVRLLLLDTSGERLHAAFAAGNPDTATHVSVTTPGLNTTVAGSVDAMMGEAIALRGLATGQLARTPGRHRETVASIGWIGYDAPQIRPGEGLVAMAEGAVGVGHDRVAGGAARDLSRFYAGLQAARDVGPAHLTAIGHSYGSLTTGLALQQPGEHGVSDAVFYGSPGIEASVPADMGLGRGHVYVMATLDDPIRWVFDGPPLLRALAPVIPGPVDDALLGVAELSGAGEFGPNPAENAAFVQMETQGMWGLEGAQGHSEYPRAGGGSSQRAPSDGVPSVRVTTHNIAAVVAGLPANIILR